MSYIYKTKGTCSTEIELDLDGNIVRNVKFTGGCNGNLQAIPKLVELAKACREAYEASKASK